MLSAPLTSRAITGRVAPQLAPVNEVHDDRGMVAQPANLERVHDLGTLEVLKRAAIHEDVVVHEAVELPVVDWLDVARPCSEVTAYVYFEALARG
jgi:hypothetical protein